MTRRNGFVLAVVCTALTALVSSVGAQDAAVASAADLAQEYVEARRADDYAALQAYRPGYSFWQHIFTIPDGHIAFGSAVDGRLLAVFPTKGNWILGADFRDPALAGILAGQRLPKDLDDRREQVAALIEQVAGPVVHNPTRGNFLLPNARRYGSFVQEWAAIYERFGVP